MKTAGKENQKRCGTQQRPEIAERKATTILLNEVGWTPRKNPAEGDVFFLDFYLYRTNQALAAVLLHVISAE